MTKVRNIPKRIQQRLSSLLHRWQDNGMIRRRAEQVADHVNLQSDLRPVIFFKASTGPSNFTYNEAFNVMAAWGLRLQGVPVIHFACHAGMSLCVLGTNLLKPKASPPCSACIAHSRALFAGGDARWFGYKQDPILDQAIISLSLEQLMNYEHVHTEKGIDSPIPLGRLVLPGLRWILRRHHLQDDVSTRFFYRQYILSAWNVAREFSNLLDMSDPQVLIVFNGQFFPEATAAWVARRRGIRVVSHEVGFQPFSGYFTEGEATAYPIDIPDSFELDEIQNARLDAYLESRFQGHFSMAGIRFWPEMRGLEGTFLRKAAGFKQIVPVFTNIIFDTSQPHANTVFSDMFEWLDMTVELAQLHPETLFVIRAHPDEVRAGKESRETVEDWVKVKGVLSLPNIVFISPKELLSSYDLIERSKFVMIYNSTIGLEATIIGVPVLCAGQARFTRYKTVFFPQNVVDFRAQAEQFLAAEKIVIPEEFKRNARRFLYYQLYRSSLPFDPFLTTSIHPSLTRFKEFSWEQLLPENSTAIATILDGVLKQGDFLLKE